MSNEHSNKPQEIDLRLELIQEMEAAPNQNVTTGYFIPAEEQEESAELFDSFFEDELAWILNIQESDSSDQHP
ncbi:MAG: hypothetical protein Q4A31_11160 [Corynebacterium sp.]|uniref:hypothetical protein n=1 Tax=Corynebacterium sp. TaxID=1720 RepID=UPI0026DD698C|nr:hypothetical protein [Corynebacterium sp.]MDO4762469.1 hypothetical protein [Corynebacterium sp.]